jgi:hypothetical protein
MEAAVHSEGTLFDHDAFFYLTARHDQFIGDAARTAFPHDGTLACDGLSTHSSVTSAATTTLLHDKDQPGYTILDENESDGKGKVDMDSFNGKLSLNKEKGEVFLKIHRRWIVDASGHKVGEVFLLRSTTNPQLFLAVDTDSPDYIVKGMAIKDMKDVSDCYWTYIWFGHIGYSPPGSGYIALQFWGTHFGPPNATPYYFVIDPKNHVPFRIAPRDVATKHGRLGIERKTTETD